MHVTNLNLSLIIQDNETVAYHCNLASRANACEHYNARNFLIIKVERIFLELSLSLFTYSGLFHYSSFILYEFCFVDCLYCVPC